MLQAPVNEAKSQDGQATRPQTPLPERERYPLSAEIPGHPSLTGNGGGSIPPSTLVRSRSAAGSLQRLYGNQAVLQMRQGSGGTPAPSVPLRPSQSRSRILQRKCACGGAAGMSGECEECGNKKKLGLQTKLKVNEPGDIYEQEADRIADQVMATPAHPAVSSAPPRIQRLAGQPTGPMDAAPASVDQALASPGRPLEPDLRHNMERRFGHDFSHVRVHADERASESAAALGADAYTVGQHVVFSRGAWDPVSATGRRLIAHELVHTVQQRGTRDEEPADAVADITPSGLAVACQPLGDIPNTLPGVEAEIQRVQRELMFPVQPLRPVLEARLQVLQVRWQQLGGGAKLAPTAPRPTAPKKLSHEEQTVLNGKAVQLAFHHGSLYQLCRLWNDRSVSENEESLRDPNFRKQMEELHIRYDQKEGEFDVDHKYVLTPRYNHVEPPLYGNFEATQLYNDILNDLLNPPEGKGLVRSVLDPIVHTICEYTEPCSSNMEQFHKDLESGMSRDEAINRGMARLTTQALVAAYPTPGPRGPIALPPGGTPPVVPFEPPVVTPPKTVLTPQTVPDVPTIPEPPPVAKSTGGRTAGNLPMPAKPTLTATAPVKPTGGKGGQTPIGEMKETTVSDPTIPAKGKRQQRQEAAKKQQQAREEAEAEQRYAEEERVDKGKGEGKKRAQDRPRKQQKELAPPASDPAFRQQVDAAVKRDLNRTGRYEGLETWDLKNLDGPFDFADADPLLQPGRGVRYQATYRRPDGSAIDVSVNYDPVGDHFGTIKESSGKPNI